MRRMSENSLKNLEKGKRTRYRTGDKQGKSEAGIASGAARRMYRDISEITARILNSEVPEETKRKLRERMPDLKDEECTNAFFMTLGQIDSAHKGNTSAFQALAEQNETARARKEAEARRNEIYHMDMDQIPDNFHRLLRDMRRHDHQQYIMHGGRGSMKSSTAAMAIIELLKNHHNVHAVVMRQVKDTIKDSVFAKLQWAIAKQGLEGEFKVTKNPMEMTLISTGQKIYFRGADDPGKIKSIAPQHGYIGILWFEELDQFGGEEAVRKIEQSVIRGGDVAWVIKTFNPPISRNNWANRYAEEPADFKLVHKSAYTDLGIEIEWLGEAFVQEAEHLRQTNPTAYDHEYAGEPVGLGTEIFPFLEIRTITDEEIDQQERIYQGQDWGWMPDPKAFVRLSYNHNTETLMLIDELGGTCIRTKDMAQQIIDKGYDDYEIRCGVDEPEHINDYRDMGLPARAAIVTPGSVRRTHEWLQCRKIIIDPQRTPKAYKEFSEYEHDVDEKTGEVIDGYPDRNNHYIDAVRYSISPIAMRRGNPA